MLISEAINKVFPLMQPPVVFYLCPNLINLNEKPLSIAD